MNENCSDLSSVSTITAQARFLTRGYCGWDSRHCAKKQKQNNLYSPPSQLSLQDCLGSEPQCSLSTERKSTFRPQHCLTRPPPQPRRQSLPQRPLPQPPAAPPAPVPPGPAAPGPPANAEPPAAAALPAAATPPTAPAPPAIIAWGSSLSLYHCVELHLHAARSEPLPPPPRGSVGVFVC